jgi:hypothetical protein
LLPQPLIFLFPSNFSAISTRAGAPTAARKQRKTGGYWELAEAPDGASAGERRSGGWLCAFAPEGDLFPSAVVKAKCPTARVLLPMPPSDAHEIERNGAARRRRTLPVTRGQPVIFLFPSVTFELGFFGAVGKSGWIGFLFPFLPKRSNTRKCSDTNVNSRLDQTR